MNTYTVHLWATNDPDEKSTMCGITDIANAPRDHVYSARAAASEPAPADCATCLLLYFAEGRVE